MYSTRDKSMPVGERACVIERQRVPSRCGRIQLGAPVRESARPSTVSGCSISHSAGSAGCAWPTTRIVGSICCARNWIGLPAESRGRLCQVRAAAAAGSNPAAGIPNGSAPRAVAGTLPLTQRLAAKERDYGSPGAAPVAPKILWFDDETTGPETVVLELRAADRIGLLFRVAGALRRCDAEVRWAKVSTLGGAVVDSFAVTPRSGRIEPGWRREVEQAVLAAAS